MAEATQQVSSPLQASRAPSEKSTRPSSLSSAPHSEHSTSSNPEKFNPGWRFYLAFSSLSVITLMAALDATSLGVALPVMAKLLKGSAIEAFWAGTSFLLTSTVFQPVMGSFSDIFGRKPLIIFNVVLFAAAAIVCALANDFTIILLGRSLQGIGGGGIICLTEVIVTDMVPLRERGKWFSFISSMWALGTVSGPLLGGGFSQNVTWRWIFWINLPFAGTGLVMIIAFLSLNYRTSSFFAKLRRVDWIGAVLFIGSATGFLIPLSWGGVMYNWTSWRTLLPLILCGIGLIAFVLYEEYVAPEPLIRTSVFKSRTSAIVYLSTVLHGIILWSLVYFLPFYYEGVKGMSPIMTGIANFPQTFTVAPASIVVGAFIAITGNYRWALWVGWVLTTLGMGILMYLKVDTSTVAWVFMNLVSGLGTGILFPSMAIAVQAAASVKDQAYAATMFSFLRAFGQTLGVAISGVIFQNHLKQKLLTFPDLAPMAAEYSKEASSLIQVIKEMPESPIKDQLKIAFVDGLKYVWLVMCIMGAIGLIVNLGVQQLSIDQELGTEQGFKHEAKKSDEETAAKEGVQAQSA